MIGKTPKPILWAARKKHVKLLRPIECQASYFVPEKHRNRLLPDCSILIPDRITDFEEKNIHIMDHNWKMVLRSTMARYMHMTINETVEVDTFSDNRYYISLCRALVNSLNLPYTENDRIGMKYGEVWI